MPIQDTLPVKIDSTASNWAVPHIEKIDAEKAAESVKNYFGKELNWKSGQDLVRVDHSTQYWQFGFLFGMLVVFAIVRVSYHNRYRQLLEAIASSRYMKQVIREEQAVNHPFPLLLLLNFCLTGAFLLFGWMSLIDHPFLPYEGFLLFIILAGLVALYLFSKTLVSLIVQFLIGEDGGQVENRYNFLLFNQLTGLLLLAPIVLFVFGPDSFYLPLLEISSGILLISYLYRLGRSLVVGINSGSSVAYIFLYLCALEIMPLIVMIKVLISEIG